MTVLSRGARNRRGGRRPGWLLLTLLLVLAIVASSALVFTNRVELLKLAVILALWAAVVAAFVSVIYRRQSDVDQARARDLKLVYDLQLDREISARREYELSVESHLRRELASELRAQAADEVAALRAELAALRANLEILFDADLGDRPALEGDRVAAGAYGDWTRDTTDDAARPRAGWRAAGSRRSAPRTHAEPHRGEPDHRRPGGTAGPAATDVRTPAAATPACRAARAVLGRLPTAVRTGAPTRTARGRRAAERPFAPPPPRPQPEPSPRRARTAAARPQPEPVAASDPNRRRVARVAAGRGSGAVAAAGRPGQQLGAAATGEQRRRRAAHRRTSPARQALDSR